MYHLICDMSIAMPIYNLIMPVVLRKLKLFRPIYRNFYYQFDVVFAKSCFLGRPQSFVRNHNGQASCFLCICAVFAGFMPTFIDTAITDTISWAQHMKDGTHLFHPLHSIFPIRKRCPFAAVLVVRVLLSQACPVGIRTRNLLLHCLCNSCTRCK